MPEQFRDRNGKVYTIELTLSKARQVRAVLPLDILNEQHFMQLMQSLAERLAFVWWLVKEQADEADISLDQWEANLMGDDVADKCSDAFLKELQSFYLAFGQKRLATLTDGMLQGMKAERKIAASPHFQQVLQQAINGAGLSVSQPTAELTGNP